jgi:hypothetical protein
MPPTEEIAPPSTPLELFAYGLHQDVLARCADEAEPEMRENAFTEVVLELLAEHNEADGADVCYWNAKSKGSISAAKLNAWSLSGDGATLDLFVVLYHGDGKPQPVARTEAEQHYRLLRGFLRRAREGFHVQVEDSDDVFEVMRRIYEAGETLATVRLFFLTDGTVRSAEVEEEQIEGCELRYVFWDITKLSRLRVGERQAIVLDFENDYDGAIPALETCDATGEYRTFLAFLPAPVLARIYGEHGQRLLERNVRAFLQAKGKVNKGLQATLREEAHRFLAYNNGLCCTAAEVDIERDKDGHVRLKKVRDFQIVNGGQTTASIFHAMKKEKTDIRHVVVQVKLTVLTDQTRMAEIVPLISKFANSQNKVNTADFSANGPYHQQMEKLSRTIWAPARSGLERGSQWYYERARGSYMDDKARQGTPARIRQWVEERPPEQKFTKTDLAKFEHSWLGLPHLVCKGAEKNFVEFAQRQEEEGAPSVTGAHFQRLIAKAILWKTAEKVFTSLELPQYRAQAVAYAVAWMADQSQRRIDLNAIWGEQRVLPMAVDVLKIVLAKAHSHLTGQVGNVGEAAKKQECWDDFRTSKIDTGDGWKREWAEMPFVEHSTERDATAAEWEDLRRRFVDDNRTIEGLENYTGREWVRTRRKDPVLDYAKLSWDQLLGRPGIGFKKARQLVEMFAIAAKDLPLKE